MRFLIVEDEATVAEVLRRALERLGYSCLHAPDACAAQRMLEEHAIEALTIDLSMPGSQGGLDLLELVAASRPDLARRTLVITGQDLGADVVERLAGCGSGILAKPFTLDGLQEAVRAQIDRPGTHPLD